MNKVSSYALLGIICAQGASASTQESAAKAYILKGEALSIGDGSFVNADKIEVMRKFQRKIVDILLGDHVSDSKRVGRYTLNATRYGVHELALMEETMQAGSSAYDDMQQCLHQAKEDFMRVTSEFRTFANGSNREIIMGLVRESCAVRGRKDSMLISWASKNEENERVIIEKKITTFKDFKQFLLDLYNFISDVITSCPKAQAQEAMRMTKWSKIKELLPELLKEVPADRKQAVQTEFLTYVKLNHLDSLNLSDITPLKLSALFAHMR